MRKKRTYKYHRDEQGTVEDNIDERTLCMMEEYEEARFQQSNREVYVTRPIARYDRNGLPERAIPMEAMHSLERKTEHRKKLSDRKEDITYVQQLV